MKVHLVLDKRLLGNTEALQQAKQRIVEQTGMASINEKRLERHGLLSGDIAPEKLHVLESIDQVSKVEADTKKYAS